MGIILWVIFGALIGWIASMITETDAEQSGLTNIIVGILGAVLGGWIMSLVGQSTVTGFDIYSFLVSLLGAIVLIGLFRTIARHSH